MSTASNTVSNSNQLFTDYDTRKIFVFNNRFNSGLFDEPDGSGEFKLEEGQLIGRIATSGKLKICDSAATDGSQYPIGIVKGNYTMAQDATDVEVTYCIAGDVDQTMLKFSGSEDLSTAVDARTFRDLLQDQGLRLVTGDEQTEFDNS